MSILNSVEFRNLARDLKSIYANRLAKRDYQVVLISRFDGDDETLRPYLSTGYEKNVKLPPQTLYPAVLLQKGGPNWVPAAQQGGGHAEETFIRSLNELGGMWKTPGLIEVYVSRIPCADRSGPWNAHAPFDEEMMFWPPGCGPKLWVAVNATPHIEWRFFWEEAYPDLQMQNDCEGQMARIAQLPNARVERCAL